MSIGGHRSSWRCKYSWWARIKWKPSLLPIINMLICLFQTKLLKIIHIYHGCDNVTAVQQFKHTRRCAGPVDRNVLWLHTAANYHQNCPGTELGMWVKRSIPQFNFIENHSFIWRWHSKCHIIFLSAWNAQVFDMREKRARQTYERTMEWEKVQMRQIDDGFVFETVDVYKICLCIQAYLLIKMCVCVCVLKWRQLTGYCDHTK